MLSTLLQQRFPVVTFVLSFLLIIASAFKIDDVTKLQISAYPRPIYPIFICGILFMFVSVAIFLYTDTPLNLRLRSRIKITKTGFEIENVHAELNISFGQIEGCETLDPASVVALPANEYFDEECMNDKKSALGAYMQSGFPEQLGAIRKLVSKSLDQRAAQLVEKEPGLQQKSYPIGSCVYLDRPLTSNRRIILTSVTTKRTGEGLRSEASFLFAAIKSISQVMADHRLTDLYMPLLGTGHGGLRKDVALLYTILAIWELLGGPSGHHLHSVNIIVYQKDEKELPAIARPVIRKILSSAEAILSEAE